MAPEFTERLQSIWKKMGISVNTQRDRVDAVLNYIQELLSDMVTDEEVLLQELIKNTEKYKTELLNLAEVLGVPPYEVGVPFLVLLLCNSCSEIESSMFLSRQTK